MKQGSTDIFNTYHLCVGKIFLTHKRRRSYNKKNTDKRALAFLPNPGLFPILLIIMAYFFCPSMTERTGHPCNPA